MADFESVLNGISVVNLHAVIVHFEPVMDIMFILATVWQFHLIWADCAALSEKETQDKSQTHLFFLSVFCSSLFSVHAVVLWMRADLKKISLRKMICCWVYFSKHYTSASLVAGEDEWSFCYRPV